MRDTALPYPGPLSMSFNLRRYVAAAISAIEITAKRTPGGKTVGARTLQTFFTAAATYLNTYVDSTAPTVSTRVRTAVNTATITFTEALDPSTSVPLSAFVFAPVRAVTAVVVTGSTVVITATGVIATDTVTYTPPALIPGAANSTNLGIKDAAGNPALTFTGVLA